MSEASVEASVPHRARAGRRQSSMSKRRMLPALRFNPLYKALDAVATAPLRGDNHGGWTQALSPRLSNYDRVAALVGAIDRLAPGASRRWSQRLLTGTPLPLAGARCTLYAFGSGSTVFRLQDGSLPEPGLVLKIYRRTLGQNDRRLMQLAQFLRGKYQTVSRWYAGAQLMIAPSSYLLMDAPLLGAPAVGMVQPFIAQKMTDLFLDYDDNALLAMMSADAAFGDQLRAFCRKTLATVTQEGRCLDFVGRDNVAVLQNGHGARQLAVLDFGIFDLAEKRAAAPAAYDQVMARLERMEQLLRAGDGDRAGADDKAKMPAGAAASRDTGQR